MESGNGGGSNDFNTRKLTELQQQVKSLKGQNTDLMTQNNILKQRVENLKELSNAP